MRRTRSGFTLVELLVALAIIALVASIVLPLFGAARERGRQTQCVARLRQLGQALAMYRQDYGSYPPMFSAWGDALMPYVKERRLFFCPSYPGDPPGISSFTSYAYEADGNRIGRTGAEIGPRSVIMYCSEHSRPGRIAVGTPGQVRPAPYTGLFILLRQDGAIEIVPAGRVKERVMKLPDREPWFGGTEGVLEFPE